jgi:hypothetical protein
MWKYAHNRLELLPEEQAHVASCNACLHLFNVCVKAEDPNRVDFNNNDSTADKRSQSA